MANEPTPVHYAEAAYGFEYGCAKVVRLCSDDKKGWVVIGIETPKFRENGGLHVYVTKTGKVRVFHVRGEWVEEWRHVESASIRRMQAEIERLRSALSDAVELYGKPGGPWNVPSDPGGWLVGARAALDGAGDEQVP